VGEVIANDKVSHSFRTLPKRNAPKHLAINEEGPMIFAAAKEGNKRARSSPSPEIEGNWNSMDPLSW
jgi:hypothetical protein